MLTTFKSEANLIYECSIGGGIMGKKDFLIEVLILIIFILLYILAKVLFI